MKRPLITLLTDFGLSDHYVAAMKGVILSICPETQLVDISHEVTPYQISEGAFLLAQAWKYFPEGTIHLVVIDPGVGSSRRAVLVEAGGHWFVAPDNGVLTMALEGMPQRTTRHLTAECFFRQPVSRTFHGRDIFAPVAAHLAAGVAAAEFGPEITDLVLLHSARPVQVSEGNWTGIALHVDRFGNIITNFDWETFRFVAEQAFTLTVGAYRVYRYFQNYASAVPGEAFVSCGSSGYLEISLTAASAAEKAGVIAGTDLQLQTRQ